MTVTAEGAAALFGLEMLIVLAGLAVVLGMFAVTATALRRTGTSPAVVRYLAVPPVVLVVVVAVVAGLLIASDLPWVAAVFLALVVVPLGAAGRRCMGTDASPATVVAVAGMAWSGPYLAGFVLVLTIPTAVGAVPGVEPATARQFGLDWVALALVAAAVAAGTAGLAGRLRPSVEAPES